MSAVSEWLAGLSFGRAKAPAYGIIDPDYARVYTQARVTAWQYGFACVMHGSFTRDLDLLLVPWESRAFDGAVQQVIRLVAVACGLRVQGGDSWDEPMKFVEKPHGRRAVTLVFPGGHDRRWIDISVMPCAAKPGS